MSSFSQSLVDMKLIHGGAFIPLYGIDDSLKINVNSFYMDQYPEEEYKNYIYGSACLFGEIDWHLFLGLLIAWDISFFSDG